MMLKLLVSLMPKLKVSRGWIMEFSPTSKLLLSSMPEVMVLRVDVYAFARSCGGTAT